MEDEGLKIQYYYKKRKRPDYESPLVITAALLSCPDHPSWSRQTWCAVEETTSIISKLESLVMRVRLRYSRSQPRQKTRYLVYPTNTPPDRHRHGEEGPPHTKPGTEVAQLFIRNKNRKLTIRYRNLLNNLSWSRMLRASHGTIYDRYFSRQSAMLHIYL